MRVAIGEHLDLMANTAEEVKGQTSVEMLGHFIWLAITSVENKKVFKKCEIIFSLFNTLYYYYCIINVLWLTILKEINIFINKTL